MWIVVISPGSVGTSRTDPGASFVVSTTGKHARVRDVVSRLQHGCHQLTAARHKDIAEGGSVVRGDGKPQQMLGCTNTIILGLGQTSQNADMIRFG